MKYARGPIRFTWANFILSLAQMGEVRFGPNKLFEAGQCGLGKREAILRPPLKSFSEPIQRGKPVGISRLGCLGEPGPPPTRGIDNGHS